MNKLPNIGLGSGGNIPIVGQSQGRAQNANKFLMAQGEMLQELIFSVAFGVAEAQALTNLKLEYLAEELDVEWPEVWPQEIVEKEIKRILPQIMESFGMLTQEQEEEEIETAPSDKGLGEFGKGNNL